MIEVGALKSEIAGNLSDAEFAKAIEAGDDRLLADLLNAPSGKTISRGVISREEFLAPLARGLVQLLGKSDPAFVGWLELLKLLPNIDTAAGVHMDALAAGVSAGVWTQEEVNAATLRPCTRAETLFGRDTVIGASDVSFALRGDR